MTPMPEFFFDLPLVPVVFASGLVTILALVAAVGAAAAHDRARTRYPEAAFLDERCATLRARVEAETEKLTDLQNELSQRQQALAEVDKNKAEAQFWQDRLAALEQEWNKLADRRQEIESVREEAQKAYEQSASARQELEDVQDRLRNGREELERLEALRGDADRMTREAEAARNRLDALAEELRVKKDELETLRQHADAAERRRDRAASDEERLAARARELEEESGRLEGAVADLQRRHEELMAATADLERQREEMRRLQDQLDASRQELARVEAALNDARDAVKLAETRVAALEAAKLQLEAEVKKLSEQRVAASGGDGGAGPTPSPREDVLAELLEAPACLKDAGFTGRADAVDEREVLAEVQRRLEAFELTFPRRVVHAFHTALKVGETSPLTVLAGVSGTGKSQLPRRYAEAMGIHFLQVPVQPRWDSPQDLMGFYNYIEQRYRATDLARALVHLDPSNFPDRARDWEGRMLLVLLDEMNLSRVEYYFSEFLSRLEVRPRIDATDSGRRADAEIPIDIPGLEDGVARKVYPGHDVLFVGTMNEDESTQSLSDKVLDRANLMRFPRPRTFANAPKPTGRERKDGRPDGFLHFESWRSWLRSTAHMRAPDRERLDGRIDRLNEILDAVGRGFGHRLHQSMAAYVANYPDGERAADAALADQVEMRILPKLRGIDVETSGRCLDELRDFVDAELGDAELAEAVGVARDKARDSGGLFVWTGLTRQ